MAAAAGPGHAPELIAKEVAFGNGQIRKGGNTLTIEAVAPPCRPPHNKETENPA